ncbi:hypothetical protein ABZ917_13820 [Nonomuraea wenchangensis]
METLFAAYPALWVAGLIVAPVAGVVRCWFAYRTAVRREEEHTRRVELAVGCTDGAHRAAVVRAADRLAPVTIRRRRLP